MYGDQIGERGREGRNPGKEATNDKVERKARSGKEEKGKRAYSLREHLNRKATM